MKLPVQLLAIVLLATASLFGQSAGELVGRWEWSASCKTGETRQGEFLLRRVSQESFRGEFLGTGHASDVIGKGILTAEHHSFQFQREYVTTAGDKRIERWQGKLSVREGANGKIVWTGTLFDADAECSFEALKQ